MNFQSYAKTEPHSAIAGSNIVFDYSTLKMGLGILGYMYREGGGGGGGRWRGRGEVEGEGALLSHG